MVCGYTERLQWERKTSGINLAKPPCVHLNLQHCFKLHRHQLHQLDLRWRMIRSSNRSDSKRKWGGDLFDKTFNVQAHLLLHISSDGMCLKDDTAWIMKQRKREKQMNNYLILVRSHLAPFFFFCNTIYIKALLIDFQLQWRWGGQAGRYQTLNSIFHSWANHVLFQQ